MRKLSLVTTAVFFLCAYGANASMIVSTGNNPQQPGEQNVLLTLNSSGNTIFGVTNQSSTVVQFTSPSMLTATSNGQSLIAASTGSFGSMTISLPASYTFTDLIFALDLPGNGTSCSACVSFSASANETNNTKATDTSPTFNLGPGNNFFTALAQGGETFNNFTITSTSGLADIRQTRISGVVVPGGVPQGAVPEPSSIALMCGGGGLFLLLRKRLARAS
jgi:hypothetical protein